MGFGGSGGAGEGLNSGPGFVSSESNRSGAGIDGGGGGDCIIMDCIGGCIGADCIRGGGGCPGVHVAVTGGIGAAERVCRIGGG